MTAAAGSASPLARHSKTRAWSAVVLLTLVGTINLADRFLPGVLTEPIKHELALSDTAIGLINGFGFLVVYAVLGIPIARVSDRGAYGLVTALCLTTWSAMTMLGGLAQSGWQLAMTRMGVAVGEAGSMPASHAYIARNFAPDQRAAPLALLTMSTPFATGLGLMAGGLLGQALGWRMAFVVVGVTGLVVAPAVLALLGLRQAVPAPEAPTASGAGASARGVAPLLKKRSIQLILAGSACISVAGYAHTTFAPALLMRAHGMTVGEVGVQYGIANCTAGVLALLFTGRVADRLSRRDPRWLLWCMAAAPILQMPLTLLGFTVGDRTQAVWFLALATIAASIWLPLTVAAMQRVTPPAQRATASAVLLFCAALFGSAGPLAAGMLSDALTPTLGAKSLPHALLLMNPAMHVLAAAFFFLAARSYRADLLPEEAKG